ncbi:hypothetical protein ACH5RR_012215 [Cinchona calisaya]|uniref:Glycosyltransferase n=1 Tax=Cinchona calisaya TaxID=153742 RepID=A0ABD3A777_9GENT
MASDGKLHVVVFPWLAFGHLIPFLELSKVIAQKGYKVSFISTPRNINRLPKLPPNLIPLINFVKLKLPRIQNLPEDAEATMDVLPQDIHFLKEALDGLEPELTRFLESSNPDWIIYDFAPYWIPKITAKLNISGAYFFVMNAWFLDFFGPTSIMMDPPKKEMGYLDYTVPPEWIPFPTNLAYRSYEVKRTQETSNKPGAGITDMYRLGSVVSGCDVIMVRHCFEFEPLWLDLLEKLHGKPVVPLGLMPPDDQEIESNDKNETWVSIKTWLDEQKELSVVYIALGSEVGLSQDELTELALGLELSGLNFFWALRKSDSIELPHGFLERIKGRGVVSESWAPQSKILSHDSVGSFLTHCGWSSIVEGLGFGRPLIMLPIAVDQGLNSRILVDTEVGIEIPRDENDGSFTRNSVAESVKKVMVYKECHIFRDKAKELSSIFGDKDLHNRYMNKFIEYLEKHKPVCKLDME